MLHSRALRKIILLWLIWAIILSSFQILVQARFQPQRPDYALSWTPSLTGPYSQNDKPYLIDRFMNEHVSFDSIFYISIALVGYDDPVVPLVEGPGGTTLSMNYAFFPFYPFLMRLALHPLRIFGLNGIASATLAGVLISLLGTLAAMLALFDLTQEELGETSGLRTAFYLLIFPTGFFLAMVFSEGVFLGLAFSALALMRRGRFGGAALLAALATWTRAVGVVLAIPLALEVFRQNWQGSLRDLLNRTFFGQAVNVLIPLGALGIWMASPLASRFRYVEKNYFGREFLQIGKSLHALSDAFARMVSSGNTQATAYHAIEFSTILLALLAAVMLLRRYPTVALFSLLALTFSLTTGAPQSLNRYVLATPATFIFLSRAGKNEIFDRAWTLASTLLMGLLVTLFTFDMWVA